MEMNKLESVIHRMETQTNLTWKRERNLILAHVSNPRDHLNILEIGSGPGVITEKLCDLFPNSQITSVELDKDLLEYHKRNLSDESRKRVTILQGDVAEIELGVEQYDIVYARLVLQHVHQVEEALKNMRRSLKENGKIIVTDIDEGLYGIIDPPVPELEYVLGKHIEEQIIEGGDRFIGRKLWRKLKAENYSDINLDLIPVNSDEIGMEAFVPQLDYEEMSSMIENQLITANDINKVKTAVDKFMMSEHPFALLVLFFVVAVK